MQDATTALAGTSTAKKTTFISAPKKLTRFASLSWSLNSLAENNAWHTDQYWITERAKHNRYSFRMLRYWYIERLINIERERLGRPLKILEIGVDRGQMKAFVDGARGSGSSTVLYSNWDAADVKPQQATLSQVGYGQCHQINLDDTNSLAKLTASHPEQYDVVILLHVLEHLTMPERALTFLSSTLKANGVVVGGFPVLPSGIARLREQQLKKNAKPCGHISAFSPRRVRKMAERSGLNVDYSSGAFAIRASGSPLEHAVWWLRLNIAFGALFPAWPGEIYWQLRKPVAMNNHQEAQ